MTPMDDLCLRNQVKYSQPMLDSGHRSSLWYGGDVLSLEHGGCVVTLRANGDVIAECKPSEDPESELISVRDKSCHGIFYEKLHGKIRDDDHLRELAANEPDEHAAYLELADSNWWEAFVDRGGVEVRSVVMDSENYDEALTEMLESIDDLTEE